jgi:DNA-binding protein YbaB
MDNDALRHEVDDVVALVQDQMQEFSAIQEKRSAITGKASAADGTVEVTVDAQRMVTGVVIDESYLEDFEFADLGGHVVTAAQAAVDEVAQRSAALLAPMTERRTAILEQAGMVGELPDFQNMLAGLGSLMGKTPTPVPVVDGDGGQDDASVRPIVRK